MGSNNLFFDELVSILNNTDKKPVLFLGTGVSKAISGNPVADWIGWLKAGHALIEKQLSVAENSTLDKLISSKNVSGLVSSAQIIKDNSKKFDLYKKWMDSTIGDLKCIDDSIVDVVHGYLSMGIPVVTTNYDLLLENQLKSVKPVSWSEQKNILDILEGKSHNYIVHLHGFYPCKDEKDDIIAGTSDYNSIKNNEAVQFLQKCFALKHLIFVGCGSTIEDPNISPMLKWFEANLKDLDITYTFLCRHGDNIPDLPPNVRKIFYGMRYSELSSFMADALNIYRNGLSVPAYSAIFTPVKAVLGKRHEVNYDSYRFDYRTRMAEFNGRDKEKKDIQDFLDGKDAFLWWAVTGPAGSGKSRLALEFALCQPPSWLCCFLKSDLEESVAMGWNPEEVKFARNILIIADYVRGRESTLGNLIIRLSSFSGKRIRLLLLERESRKDTGSWYWQLSNGDYRKGEVISGVLFKSEFLDLKPLEIEAQRAIAESTLKRLKKSYSLGDIDSMIEKLSQIDEGLCRPLYLQMLAEALNGASIQSREDLLELIIAKEKVRWESIFRGIATGLSDDEINTCMAYLSQLMAFANSVGKVELENSADLPEIISNCWQSLKGMLVKRLPIGTKMERFEQNFICSLNQNRDEGDWLYSIQPDIIREYLVLNCFFDISMVDDFLNGAWQYKSSEFAIFLIRLGQDFPDNKLIIELLKAPKLDTHWIIWMKVNISIKIYLPKKFQNIVKESLKLFFSNIQQSEDEEYHVACSHGLLDLIWDNEKPGLELKAVEKLIEELKQQSQEHPLNEKIIIEYSKRLYSLVTDYEEAEILEAAQKLAEELKQLAHEHPKNEKIIAVYALGLVALITLYEDSGQLEVAQKLVEELKQLAYEHPLNEEIIVAYADGLAALITLYGNLGQLEAAQKLMEELKQLAQEHPKNEEIIVAYADGLGKFIMIDGNSGQSEVSQKLLKELKQLVRKHPKNEEIIVSYAKGLFSHIGDYVNLGQLEAAQKLMKELKQLTQEHPKNKEIIVSYAHGLSIFITVYENSGQLEAAQMMMKELKHLAYKHPKNEEIIVSYADGLFSSITFYGNSGQLEAAQKLMNELKLLAYEHPKNEEIILEYAKGLNNLIMFSGCFGDIKAINAFKKQLKNLIQDFGQNLVTLESKNVLAEICDYVFKNPAFFIAILLNVTLLQLTKVYKWFRHIFRIAFKKVSG